MDDILQTLLDTDREFSAYSATHNPAEAFKKYLTDDAIALPDGQNPQIGIDAIYESMSSDISSKLTWEPQSGKVSLDGTMGYTWGIYTLVLENGNILTGKYLNVWERQPDGSYKVIADMGNSNS